MGIAGLARPFNNRVAVIIGGSRGIGRSVALDFARLGANVAISFLRNEKAANAVAREIRTRWKRRALLSRANVGSATDIVELFDEIGSKFGRIDYLVFSAGLTVFKPLHSLNVAQIKRVLDVNVTGFLLCVKHAADLMVKGGSVVAISSLGSQRYFENYGPIGIAKACVESAVRYLAVELSNRKIRVNAVSSGVIDTDSIKAIPSYKARRNALIRLTPAKRAGSTRDVSRVVLFLCQQDSSWVTGQTIIADGGLSLCLEGSR